MECMKFLPKAVTVCFGKEKIYDCKNNHGCGELANFRLNKIIKINCRTLVVFSYTLLGLELKKA